MNAENHLRWCTELLRSTRAQIGAGRVGSQDMLEVVRQTEQVIAATHDRMTESDRAIQKWWYQPEILHR